MSELKLSTLIIHGLFGSGRNWRGIVKKLQPQLPGDILPIDVRNHGTAPHVAGMHLSDLAHDINLAVTSHGLMHCNLIGHSLGGKIAMATALIYPKVVDKLVVVDVLPTKNDFKMEFFSTLLKTLRGIRLDDSSVGLSEMRSRILQGLNICFQTKMERDFIASNLVKENGKFRWLFNLDHLLNGLPDILDFPFAPSDYAFPKPTLLIYGKDGGYIDEKNVHIATSYFSDLQIVGLDGCGHWVHFDKPDEFVRIVVDFLCN